MHFRQFLLNESTAYLNQKVGDILNALQDLNQDADQMGTRFLVKNTEKIVNQMRSVLHQSWPQSKQNDIKLLQKCAIALMKAIDEKEDLKNVLQKCAQNLQSFGSNTPINQMASPVDQELPKIDVKDNKGVAEPQQQPPRSNNQKSEKNAQPKPLPQSQPQAKQLTSMQSPLANI